MGNGPRLPSHSSLNLWRLQSHSRAGIGVDEHVRTLGSLPQAHCMYDSARRELGSRARSSSSESLLGDSSPSEARLQKIKPGGHQVRLLPWPPTPAQKKRKERFVHIFMPVLYLEYGKI